MSSEPDDGQPGANEILQCGAPTAADDLKSQIINVVVVLLVVTFLASVITWNGDESVIYFGGALGFVIISVSVYTLIHNRAEHEADPK